NLARKADNFFRSKPGPGIPHRQFLPGSIRNGSSPNSNSFSRSNPLRLQGDRFTQSQVLARAPILGTNRDEFGCATLSKARANGGARISPYRRSGGPRGADRSIITIALHWFQTGFANGSL